MEVSSGSCVTSMRLDYPIPSRVKMLSMVSDEKRPHVNKLLGKIGSTISPESLQIIEQFAGPIGPLASGIEESQQAGSRQHHLDPAMAESRRPLSPT